MARILVIDDEDAYRQMIRQMLEQAGYDVLEVSNGKDGLNVYQAEKPDLVITDLIMPEQEGIETIIGLRRENPDARIIAISGGGRIAATDFLPIARKFGARHVLAKPFRREQLLEAIRDSLGETAA